MSEPSAFLATPSERFGVLALIHCGKSLPLQVLQSAAGHYIGTKDDDGPVSRESVEYFPTSAAAQYAMDTHTWTQRTAPELSTREALPREALEQIVRDMVHFDQAPSAFFRAWKRGAEIAGAEWFGDGTEEGLRRAKSKWDLRPNMLMVNDALGVLSPSQGVFLSAMVSFYNAKEGGAMLRRVRFAGFADLTNLDLERRQVIADLILNYVGW